MHPDYQARTIGYPGNPGTGEDKLLRTPTKVCSIKTHKTFPLSPDRQKSLLLAMACTQIHGMSGGALVNPQNQLVCLVILYRCI